MEINNKKNKNKKAKNFIYPQSNITFNYLLVFNYYGTRQKCSEK